MAHQASCTIKHRQLITGLKAHTKIPHTLVSCKTDSWQKDTLTLLHLQSHTSDSSFHSRDFLQQQSTLSILTVPFCLTAYLAGVPPGKVSPTRQNHWRLLQLLFYLHGGLVPGTAAVRRRRHR